MMTGAMAITIGVLAKWRDWRREELRRPGSVPEAVLRIMNALRRG